MAISNNIGLLNLAATQTAPHVPVNTDVNKLDESINADITKTFADLNITLTAAEFLENYLHKLDGSVTAAREYIVPALATIETENDLTVRKTFVVHVATTGGDITVKTPSGTGVTMRAGDKARLYVDGTNVVRLDGPSNTLADQQTHPQSPVYHRFDVPDGATADIDVTVQLAVRVIGMKIIKTGAAGGTGDTIQLKNGVNAITDAVSINVADQTVISAPGTIDDAQWDIPGGGTLRVTRTKASGASVACTVIVECILV